MQTTKLILLVFPLLLSGCAVPVVVSMITGTASVAVNETTGRTITDHTVSSVSGQDCQISRAFKNEAVCQDPAIVKLQVMTTGVEPSTIEEIQAKYSRQ